MTIPQKRLDECFHDWESHVFGYGYGSGEQHTLGALKGFFDVVGQGERSPTAYSYELLEAALGPQVTWLLINLLCKLDMIEYGCSPRFGWLTEKGVSLMAFMKLQSLEELYQICTDLSYNSCTPRACYCGPDGYVEGRECPNPFFNNLWVPGESETL